MTLLTRMDLGVGALLDRAFRLGRGFQPVDLARLLRREALKEERRTLEAAFAPDQYLVHLAPADFRRLEPIGDLVREDLTRSLSEHVAAQGLKLLGDIVVRLEADAGLKPGRVAVSSGFGPEGEDATLG